VLHHIITVLLCRYGAKGSYAKSDKEIVCLAKSNDLTYLNIDKKVGPIITDAFLNNENSIAELHLNFKAVYKKNINLLNLKYCNRSKTKNFKTINYWFYKK